MYSERRSVRRPSHDYGGPGAWLITIKCFAGLHSFGEVVEQSPGDVTEKRMVLNEIGSLVRSIWESVPRHHPNVRSDHFVVMPNHMHMVLRLFRSDDRLLSRADREERFGHPVPGSVSTIIRSFKSEATRQVRLRVGKPVVLWQARFHDRSLADAAAIEQARIYIRNNPARWRVSPPRPRSHEYDLINFGSSRELAVPAHELAIPAHELAIPAHELAIPAHELAIPAHELAIPEQDVDE